MPEQSIFTGISGDSYYEDGVVIFTAPTVSANTTIRVSLNGNIHSIGSYLPSYVGNPNQVLTTAQAGFIVAQTLKNKNPSRVITLDFSAGTYSGINAQSYPACSFNIRITGAGRASTHLGGIHGWNITVTGNKSIDLGDIHSQLYVDSYIDTDNIFNHSVTYSGQISLTNCVANNLYGGGDVYIDAPDGTRYGLDGASITLISCEINSAFAGRGGPMDNGGTIGSGGGINVTSDTIATNGAFSGYNNKDSGGNSGASLYPDDQLYKEMGQITIDSIGTDYVSYPASASFVVNRGFGNILYRNGYYGSGGYGGTHYTNGRPDQYTGIDYDYAYNQVSSYYYNGQEFFDWYFTNYTTDGKWSTLANWSYPEGGGINPQSVPWTEPITARQNLHLTHDNPVPTLNGTFIGGSSGNWFINGTCNYQIALEILNNGFNTINTVVPNK
jgi:hypothetical protein